MFSYLHSALVQHAPRIVYLRKSNSPLAQQQISGPISIAIKPRPQVGTGFIQHRNCHERKPSEHSNKPTEGVRFPSRATYCPVECYFWGAMEAAHRSAWRGGNRLRGGLLLASVWILGTGLLGAQEHTALDQARWKSEAARVTIVRDDWGIAHVHGKSDADAVFGTIYAQCEDDFNLVETNYLTSLGRTAEAEGEGDLWQDLRYRLFLDPAELQRDYAASPEWLKQLMNAWADGINFYLAGHPETKPKVLTRFEPWMALSFTEGSINGDIERVDLKKLQAFYDSRGSGAGLVSQVEQPPTEPPRDVEWAEPEPSGSNGFA